VRRTCTPTKVTSLRRTAAAPAPLFDMLLLLVGAGVGEVEADGGVRAVLRAAGVPGLLVTQSLTNAFRPLDSIFSELNLQFTKKSYI